MSMRVSVPPDSVKPSSSCVVEAAYFVKPRLALSPDYRVHATSARTSGDGMRDGTVAFAFPQQHDQFGVVLLDPQVGEQSFSAERRDLIRHRPVVHRPPRFRAAITHSNRATESLLKKSDCFGLNLPCTRYFRVANAVRVVDVVGLSVDGKPAVRIHNASQISKNQGFIHINIIPRGRHGTC